VPEGVEREGVEREGVEREGVEREVSHTRERTCPRVLALQTRRLNVAALRRRRENPWP
jgi:hypothetical protein